MKPGLGPDLEVWLVDLVAAGFVLDALEATHALLPRATTAPPAASSTVSTGSGRHRAARIALRAVLAGRCGATTARLPFVIGTAGKPHLQAVPGRAALHFSLAHCEEAALIAVSPAGPVGVDVEAIRAVRINSDRRAMLEAAAVTLSPGEPLPPASDQDRRFLQAWVRLEALAKATGEGISALLGRLGVRGPSLLSPAGADPSSPGMQVRDLALDGQPSLLAAIAGAAVVLPPMLPSPLVRPLPLDAAWLDALVRSGSGGASVP